MGGLIVFIFLGGYLWVCMRATGWLVGRCPWPSRWPRWPRVLLLPPVLALVFVLPVADELLARPKFNALCEEGAVLKIDAQRIRGRTIRLDIDPSERPMEGMIVPILHSHLSYRDVTTGEEMAHYEVYLARAGLLSRLLEFPEGGGGLTGLGTCWPPAVGTLPQRFGFTLIN
jgi:hypothetical protein